DGIEIRAQHGRVRISVASPTVVRVQYSLHEQFSQRVSFAVMPDAFHGETPTLKVEDSAQHLSLETGALVILIEKSPLRIFFQDASGKVIEEDQPDRPPVFNVTTEGAAFKVWKNM